MSKKLVITITESFIAECLAEDGYEVNPNRVKAIFNAIENDEKLSECSIVHDYIEFLAEEENWEGA